MLCAFAECTGCTGTPVWFTSAQHNSISQCSSHQLGRCHAINISSVAPETKEMSSPRISTTHAPHLVPQEVFTQHEQCKDCLRHVRCMCLPMHVEHQIFCQVQLSCLPCPWPCTTTKGNWHASLSRTGMRRAVETQLHPPKSA